MNRIVRLL